jgi:thiol-disulfide isomerase/thioredoxin
MGESCKPVRTVTFSEAQKKIASGKKLLVHFAADWCGACQKSLPEVDKASCELEKSGVEVVRVDVDKNPYMLAKHKVEAYPTVIEFQGGKEVRRNEGADKAEKYVKMATKE